MTFNTPSRKIIDSGPLAEAFARLTELLDRDPDLIRRGAYLDTRFRVEIGDIPFDVKIDGGRITSLDRGPFLMRSWRFVVRGTAEAWSELWAPIP